jgi:hypothetical protein
MVKAQDLINEQREREKHKEKVYKKIYKKVETKIVQASSMNSYECWYQIPEFIFNIPLYNLEGCKNYLRKKLTNDGFLIQFTDVNIIYISWGKN